MSAYVVDDKTINRILAYLRENSTISEQYVGKTLLNGEASQLGQDMFTINYQAVDQRYKIGEGERQHPMKFKYKVIPCASLVQTYKSLRCWLYQCSEGNIPETNLYKQFEKIADHLCREIVFQLPAYDKAEWA